MGRSRITTPSKDLIEDDGSVLISVIRGEQIHLTVTLSWLTNMSSYTIASKVLEANNAPAYDADGELLKYPTAVLTAGVATSLQIIDEDPSDNTFKIVIPQSLVDSWAIKPTPTKPVYGFIDLEVSDGNTGINQVIHKPISGLLEILFSPTDNT